MPPGQVDFGTFSPPKGGGEYVEVCLPSNLIALAGRFVEKEEPELAQILNNLKRVQVNVIGLEEANRNEILERVQKVRKDLDGKGWQRIVTAQQKDQDVSVYLKMGEKDAVQGLVVVVVDGKAHAVFVNIVGDIKPDQVAMLGDKLDIDPLKKIGKKFEKKSKHEAKAESKAEPKAEE